MVTSTPLPVIVKRLLTVPESVLPFRSIVIDLLIVCTAAKSLTDLFNVMVAPLTALAAVNAASHDSYGVVTSL